MAGLTNRSHDHGDPRLVAIVALGVATFLGTIAAAGGGAYLANPLVIQTAVSLLIATGVLISVGLAQIARLAPPSADTPGEPGPVIPVTDADRLPVPTTDTPGPPEARLSFTSRVAAPFLRAWRVVRSFHLRGARYQETSWFVTAGAGILATGVWLLAGPSQPVPAPGLSLAALAAGACLLGAALAATAVSYLDGIEPSDLPESAELARGGRVLAWLFVLDALSVGFTWAGLERVLWIPQIVVSLTNLAVCYSLLRMKPGRDEGTRFRIGVLAVLGSQSNMLESLLRSAETQLGIDLRSTWALTIVRRSIEPLVLGLCAVGWLSTSFTVVGTDEEGLVQRLGVPQSGAALQPGLHVHLPWPFDDVIRIPSKRVQSINVGHEGEEEGGPENVLWAVEHAANEYTLLLGNGRDLITIDATVNFRITNPRAWHYNCQNPVETLKAIAYRAVMRTTVNKTLTDALSENVVTSSAYMRSLVQQDADSLQLGVEVTGFTLGGMHPPVPVSSAYQSVVSAQVGKVTAVTNAQVYRNQTVPAAQTAALVNANRALADGADARARAAGEASSFVVLDAQYRSEPQDYFFRRRIEKLEQDLAGRRFTVVDSRFQRDGGELWIVP